jgi:hypothetical protein
MGSTLPKDCTDAVHAMCCVQVLDSLWQALGVEDMADDRAIFIKMMAGPFRLHSKSLETVGSWPDV